MNSATCHFCGQGFRNRQAVRAHLKACAAYRQMPQAELPREGPQSVHELTGGEEVSQQPAAPPAARPRRQKPPLPSAWLREQQAATDRAQRAAEERTASERRRRIIQRVKDQVIGGWRLWGHTIPGETTAQALTEIEAALAKLPVGELPEAELVTIAEGIRDRLYKPAMQAQDRAKAEEARKQQQDRRRADRIEAGVAYAVRELRREADLDGWTRGTIEGKIKQTLEQDIADDESEADVEARVDEILDRELDAVDEQRRAKARPELITHGRAYATRELLRVKDLDAWDRSRIEGVVKQELEREITGEESEEDVEDLAEQILDDELGEPGENDEED